MTGLTVNVNPSSFSINPGQTKTLEITIANATAALNAYVGGQFRLSDGTHVVRVPLVVRPVALGVTAEVTSTGGPVSYDMKFGYTGPFSATPRGLIPAVTASGTIADDPADGGCTGVSGLTPTASNIVLPAVPVPAGTTYARFSLFDANASPASDIDMCVYRGTTLVGSSGSGTSAEVVNLVNPTAGSYTVVLHGFAVPAGGASFTQFSWALGTADAGNMTVTAPASATIGTTGTITLAFSGLTPGTKYLGSVAYSGAASLPNPTIVRVNP